MKRALLLLALAACGRKAPDRVTQCTRTCDHVSTLQEADLEVSIGRMSDHADSDTIDHLRSQGQQARDLDRDLCLQHCLEPDWPIRCVDAATSYEEAKACVTASP